MGILCGDISERATPMPRGFVSDVIPSSDWESWVCSNVQPSWHSCSANLSMCRIWPSCSSSPVGSWWTWTTTSSSTTATTWPFSWTWWKQRTSSRSSSRSYKDPQAALNGTTSLKAGKFDPTELSLVPRLVAFTWIHCLWGGPRPHSAGPETAWKICYRCEHGTSLCWVYYYYFLFYFILFPSGDGPDLLFHRWEHAATLTWLSEPGQRQGTASARCLPWPVTDPTLGFGFLPNHQSCTTFKPFPAGLSPALSFFLSTETFTDAFKTHCWTDTVCSHAPHPAISECKYHKGLHSPCLYISDVLFLLYFIYV